MPPVAETPWRFRLTASVTAIYWTALAITTHAPLKLDQIAPALPPWYDKIYHVGAFWILGVLLSATFDAYAGWKSGRASPQWRGQAITIAVAVVYATLDELTQPLTGRFCDIWDWVADVIGAIAGVVMYRRLLAAKLQR